MRISNRADGKIRQIPVYHILPNENQPRVDFSEEELHELAESIRANGVLQPLTVRRNKQGDFELIAGERRLRASILAGLETVPCVLVNCNEEQSAVFALLENLQRVDLGPFEEAEGIQRLIQVWNITQEEAARRLGKRQSTIANKLRLLRLSEQERRQITTNGLSERHARALLRLPEEKDRLEILQEVVERRLNVQQTEQLINHFLDRAAEENKAHIKKTVIIKDVRIFMNTINKAVDTMRLSGIPAVTERSETEDYIECVVRIPKSVAISRKPA